jgi:hypothetical protein
MRRVLLGVLTSLALGVTVVPAAPALADDTVTIAVDTAHPGARLASDAVGLSFEERELGTGGFRAGTGNLAALLRGLGRGNLRISGNTLDRDTLWVPAGQQPPDPLPSWVQDVVTPADVARLGAFVDATGWRTEVGINVGHYDPALATDEARTLSALGRRLAAVECGNEPNAWAGKFRTSPYGYAQYKPDWEACAAAVEAAWTGHGPARIAGPDTSSPTSTAAWVAAFAQDERDRLVMLTQHAYSVGSHATVTDLLSARTDAAELASIAPDVAAARATGLPLRLDETNSAAGGGVAGVSDTYASALWSLDYTLLTAQDGVAGLNFHGGLGVCDAPLYNGKFQLYTPLCAADTADAAAAVYTARPEYYGLYLASRLGTGRFLPVTVTAPAGQSVTAYAVRGDDGHLRVAVIDKDPTGTPTRVRITGTHGEAVGSGEAVANGPRHHGTASLIHLTGTALDATTGTAVQGATVGRDGRLPHRPADRARLHDGTLATTIPSGSAALATL